MEQSQLLHLIIAALSLYMFAVFAWWWIKQRSATTIYGVTCFLMFGLFSSHMGAWWIYEQIQMGKKMSDIISVYMYVRHYATLIPLIFYAYYVTKRACFTKPVKYGRRRDDH